MEINAIVNSSYNNERQKEIEAHLVLIEQKKKEEEEQQSNAHTWKKWLSALQYEFVRRSPFMIALIAFLVSSIIYIGPWSMYDAAYNKYDRERDYWKLFVDTYKDKPIDNVVDAEWTELTRRRLHKYTPYVNMGTHRYMMNMLWYWTFETFWIVVYGAIYHWIISMICLTLFLILCYIYQPQIYFAISLPLSLLPSRKKGKSIKEE